MNLFKAIEIFEKLAQQKVNLQPQKVVGVSATEVNQLVNSVMVSLGRYDQNVGWKSESVLMPNDSYKVIVIAESSVLNELLIRQQIEEALYLRWPDNTFNVEIYLNG